jgi:hypothetical protein
MKSTLAACVLPLLAQLSPAVAQLDFLKLKTQFGMKHMDLNDFHQKAVDDDEIVIMGKGTFDQLLDHNHPEEGTFKQRFWWNAEFYEEE